MVGRLKTLKKIPNTQIQSTSTSWNRDQVKIDGSGVWVFDCYNTWNISVKKYRIMLELDI